MKTDKHIRSYVKQIIKEKDKARIEELIYELLELKEQPPLPEKCQLINIDSSLEFVLFNDICFATADRCDTLITVWRNNKEELFLYGSNIGELDKFLERYGFLRVHESYLINPNSIARHVKELNKLVMISGSLVPVSKPHRAVVAALFPVIKAPSRKLLRRAS